MDTELGNSVSLTETVAQYDASAKRLLGQKIILSHILKSTVEEFQDMEPEDIVWLIEGMPLIGTAFVEPGMTNVTRKSNGEKIVGLNTESTELDEGIVKFDILFYVRTKDGLSQIIVNVEAQKDEPSDYMILNRSIFYSSRMISSQKEREFTNSNYNDIKQVYSLWVCMNMSENSLCHIHLTKKDLLGTFNWKGNLKLFNIVMIGLTEEPPKAEEATELHRLLGVLLSNVLTASEKLNIMESEYHLIDKESIQGGMTQMCNLGEGILEKGIAQGIVIGEERGEIKAYLNLVNEGILTMTDVATRLGCTEKEIAKMIKYET